jgi:hypothetical protein
VLHPPSTIDGTVSAAFELTSNPGKFHLKEVLRAKNGGGEIFSREKIIVIKRELL